MDVAALRRLAGLILMPGLMMAADNDNAQGNTWEEYLPPIVRAVLLAENSIVLSPAVKEAINYYRLAASPAAIERSTTVKAPVVAGLVHPQFNHPGRIREIISYCRSSGHRGFSRR